MENTYSYIFWFNYHNNTWYAIPRDKYTLFFSDTRNDEGVFKSSRIETLISIINNPELINNIK
jgi:hypothetical protein